MGIKLILTIIIGLSLSLVIILWVSGIDYMKRNHPDYNGDDMLDEEEDDEND